MRTKILLILFFLVFLINPLTGKSQTVNDQDSLALVDLYNSTNGPGWLRQTNWLTTAPLSSWYGVVVVNGRVDSLKLRFCNLIGTIPASLGSLSGLVSLDLSMNKLSDTIPSSIGSLSNLIALQLSSNKLTGGIPSSLGNLSHLTWLHLSSNQLSGNIPSSLGDLSNLGRLEIGYNQLNGSIPASFSNLSNLNYLYLPNNQLSGSVPSFLGNLSKLVLIDLSHNLLADTIPASIGNLPSLSNFYLAYNQISGHLPASIGNLSGLYILNFSNNQMSGNIPSGLGNLPHISSISLDNNNLSGNIPSSLIGHDNLQNLHLSNNKFLFDGLEDIANSYNNGNFTYAPQATIPLNRYGNLLSLSAGGTLGNDTFRLYKDGLLNMSQIGDSTFIISTTGKYYVTVTNRIASQLTLYSTVDTIGGLLLTDTTTTVTLNTSGNNPLNVEDQYHKLLLTIKPDGGINSLSGDVTYKVTIDTAIASHNNQPYVQRHYDINPANNASSATATVTLYFTQQEFDSFNNFPGHGLDLPIAPDDNTGKRNLRVYQYHGFSAASVPGSYPGSAVEIDPNDTNIVWNSDSQYWEVSFDVNGFSGFFISSANSSILPIRLLSFAGKVHGDNALLQWTALSELNTGYFEIQRSKNGIDYTQLAKVIATGNLHENINYQYSDPLGINPIYYYRLKIFDRDGDYTYSSIIKIVSTNNKSAFKIYPNPATESFIIELPPTTGETKIKLIDMAGRLIRTLAVSKGILQTRMIVSGLPPGSYNVEFNDGVKMMSGTLVIE